MHVTELNDVFLYFYTNLNDFVDFVDFAMLFIILKLNPE